MDLTLLVLAAGMGSRYGGLKQLDGMGPSGETIMDYSLFDAKRAGFTKVVFVIRREMEDAFREIIVSKMDKSFKVDFAYQELDMIPAGFEVPASRKKPWGTAHAVLVAANLIDTPFAVINADDFYGANAYRIVADHLREHVNDSTPEYNMAGYRLDATLSPHGSVARGVCTCDNNGYLDNVEELTKIQRSGDKIINTDDDGQTRELTDNTPVSMNFWGFTPSIFAFIESQFSEFLQNHGQEEKSEYFIPTVVTRLLADQKAKMRVLPCSDKWFGVTYQNDKPTVIEKIRALVESGQYPQQLNRA